MKIIEELTYSLENYLKLEERNGVKHEYYNGKLLHIPVPTVFHNNTCLKLFHAIYNRLHPCGYQVNPGNARVKIENEGIYLCPDVLVTKELVQTVKNTVVYQPLLVAEVPVDSTRKYDYTDKFIQYRKNSSLRYYIILEPEKHVVFFYEKDENGEWSAKTYTEVDEVISLPFFPAEFTLADIYS